MQSEEGAHDSCLHQLKERKNRAVFQLLGVSSSAAEWRLSASNTISKQRYSKAQGAAASEKGAPWPVCVVCVSHELPAQTSGSAAAASKG